MEPQVLSTIGNLGLPGIIFVIWYFDQKKIQELKDIVGEQVQDKQQMRDDRQELIAIVKDNAELIQKATTAMDRLLQKVS